MLRQGRKPLPFGLMYAVNTSLIGTYISLVFGVTRENVKAAKYYYRKWRNPDSSALEVRIGRAQGGRGLRRGGKASV